MKNYMQALKAKTSYQVVLENTHGTAPWKTTRELFPLNEAFRSSTCIEISVYLKKVTPKTLVILRTLSKYSNFNNNWDEEGSLKPSEGTITKAKNAIMEIEEFDLPFYFSAPGPNGEILLEFKDKEDSAELYFEEGRSEEMILYKGSNQVYVGEMNKFKLINHFGFTN